MPRPKQYSFAVDLEIVRNNLEIRFTNAARKNFKHNKRVWLGAFYTKMKKASFCATDPPSTKNHVLKHENTRFGARTANRPFLEKINKIMLFLTQNYSPTIHKNLK